MGTTDPAFTWEASYDALGRRLQTCYTKSGEQPCVTHSLYDPNEEFQEIGVEIEGTTFWKFYGPNGSCDAIHDDTGASVTLMHNALRQLTGVISSQGTQHSKALPSAYGPLETPSAPSADLMDYAQSLSWHSKSQDPTGFIWMGDRYYDSRSGRFLSQDPISYPSCLDLYTYASGDPINNFDPDGRFASAVYEPVKNTVLEVWNHPRFQGAWQAARGFAKCTAGVALASTGAFVGVGAGMFAHGVDQCATGGYAALTGSYRATLTEQVLQYAGMSSEMACLTNGLLGMCGPSSGAARNLTRQSSRTVSQGAQAAKGPFAIVYNFKAFTRQNARENLMILTGIKPPSNIHAHHVFPVCLEKNFLKAGINIHHPKNLTWWEAKSHLQEANKYNKDWRRFFRQYSDPTEAQILEHGTKLMNKHGIPTNY